MAKYGKFENLDLIEEEMKKAGLMEQKLMTDGLEVPVAEIKSINIEETGHNTQVNVYYPEGEGPFPVMVYIHGGGFISGFNKMDESTFRTICHDANCTIISPNYVFAPAHKWPEALNEVYDVICYFKNHAKEYNLDMDKIAIGGNSAGGNLAAACIVKASERNELNFIYAALCYPALDSVLKEGRADEFTDTRVMNEQMLEQVYGMYIPDGENPKNPLIAPLYADPSVFPPTSIFSGRRDFLMSEQKEFADKLIKAGIDVTYRCYADAPHGFLEVAGNEYVARDCKKIMAQEVRWAFSK